MLLFWFQCCTDKQSNFLTQCFFYWGMFSALQCFCYQVQLGNSQDRQQKGLAATLRRDGLYKNPWLSFSGLLDWFFRSAGWWKIIEPQHHIKLGSTKTKPMSFFFLWVLKDKSSWSFPIKSNKDVTSNQTSCVFIFRCSSVGDLAILPKIHSTKPAVCLAIC